MARARCWGTASSITSPRTWSVTISTHSLDKHILDAEILVSFLHTLEKSVWKFCWILAPKVYAVMYCKCNESARVTLIVLIDFSIEE